MKVVILAGGRGTRISEETNAIPKPMVEIGGKPILWHIMKTYSFYGFNEFIICLGYRGYMIKEYFSHYFLHMSDVTIDMTNNDINIHATATEPWKVTLVDTGMDSMTGGRIQRIENYVNKERFMLTYGDGVSDINIQSLIDYHEKKKCLVTVSAVQPPGRFGSLDISEEGKVVSFLEKPKGDKIWLSAGYFVVEPEMFSYLKGDATVWEMEPLVTAAAKGKLAAYKHNGFWKPMDTLRDKIELENLWQKGGAPWKVWSK